MSKDNSNHFIKLVPVVQDYKWGKPANTSLIAKLIEDASSYEYLAELWLGAHPKAPALIANSNLNLIQFLKEHATNFMGAKICSKFKNSLPFLFKILSVNSSLSIQAHPSIELAKKLHAKDPKNYPDENHKPELAIVLSDSLELLYGFRKLEEISNFVKKIPALNFILSEKSKKDLQSREKADSEILKNLYSEIILAEETKQKKVIKLLKEQGVGDAEAGIKKWIEELVEKYPNGDRGILSFFILKYYELSKGEALFIEPAIPHAYLRGDLTECMATSDNVIRAGLTYKFCDELVLLDMLNFDNVSQILDIRKETEENFLTYETPAKEFKVSKLSKGLSKKMNFEGLELLFCLSGTTIINKEISMNKGEAYLVSDKCSNYLVEIKEGETFHVRVPV